MRWILRLSLILTVVWALLALSPFWALYSLSRAVQARDVAAVSERVNFRAVRASLARQLVTAYLIATGRENELKSSAGRIASGLGATLAEPIVAELVTPQALIGLLEDGWPESATRVDKPSGLSGIGSLGLGDAWGVFLAAEARGFRKVFVSAPVDRPAAERFRIELRLNRSLTWRVTGIELPQELRQRLVQELIKRGNTAWNG